MQSKLVNFFTKKTIVDQVSDEQALMERMNDIDKLFIPAHRPAPADISFMDDQENPYVGTPQVTQTP